MVTTHMRNLVSHRWISKGRNKRKAGIIRQVVRRLFADLR